MTDFSRIHSDLLLFAADAIDKQIPQSFSENVNKEDERLVSNIFTEYMYKLDRYYANIPIPRQEQEVNNWLIKYTLPYLFEALHKLFSSNHQWYTKCNMDSNSHLLVIMACNELVSAIISRGKYLLHKYDLDHLLEPAQIEAIKHKFIYEQFKFATNAVCNLKRFELPIGGNTTVTHVFNRKYQQKSITWTPNQKLALIREHSSYVHNDDVKLKFESMVMPSKDDPVVTFHHTIMPPEPETEEQQKSNKSLYYVQLITIEHWMKYINNFPHSDDNIALVDFRQYIWNNSTDVGPFTLSFYVDNVFRIHINDTNVNHHFLSIYKLVKNVCNVLKELELKEEIITGEYLARVCPLVYCRRYRTSNITVYKILAWDLLVTICNYVLNNYLMNISEDNHNKVGGIEVLAFNLYTNIIPTIFQSMTNKIDLHYNAAELSDHQPTQTVVFNIYGNSELYKELFKSYQKHLNIDQQITNYIIKTWFRECLKMVMNFKIYHFNITNSGQISTSKK